MLRILDQQELLAEQVVNHTDYDGTMQDTVEYDECAKEVAS